MAAREPFNVTMRSLPASMTTQRSPGHSPVPYLFGGLAAMLGLIAFALLILACSYWKFSGYLDNEGESDLEAGKDDKTDQKSPPVFEEKILVIMAGDANPTFLATPISSRTSSFGDNSSTTCNCGKSTDKITDYVKSETSSAGPENANNTEEASTDHQTHQPN